MSAVWRWKIQDGDLRPDDELYVHIYLHARNPRGSYTVQSVEHGWATEVGVDDKYFQIEESAAKPFSSQAR